MTAESNGHGGVNSHHSVMDDNRNDNDNDSNVNDDGDNELPPSLIIPITSSASARRENLFVEIFPEEMETTSASTLIKVLRDEKADVDLWADAALLYMYHKHARDSLAVLEEACELYGGNNSNHLSKAQRVRILAAAGIAHLAANQQEYGNNNQRPGGSSAAAGGDKDELIQQADQKFTQAGKVDTFFPMTWIGRGMLNLGKKRLDQAKFFFQTTLKQCGPVMPALLGMAAVLYGEADYKGAQAKYAESIRRYPVKSGASTRVGFGFACYKLGQVDRAKAAFARALTIDPECVEAMVGAAILEMAGLDESAKDFSSRTEKAIKMMSMANLLDHSNAMVQNHLANHYFWKWTPLTGTVEVVQGSTLVKSSQPIPLDAGEPIRIGPRFETSVKEDISLDDEDGTTFRIATPWKDISTSGLKVWKKDYERVLALAKGAYNSTSVQEIQAESLFLLGRVYHVREDNDMAHKFYERACKLAPDLSPARFGLAQTLVVKEDYVEATNQLRQLTATGAATDALALLGLLVVRSGKDPEEGLGYLRKAIEQDPLNAELVALEALALQQHRSNYPKALDRYKRAVDLMKQKGTPISYELYANIGVLCFETKRYDEALKMYKNALRALDHDGSAQHATLENKGIIGGILRLPDNNMFFDFVDTQLMIESTDNDKKLIRVVDSSDAHLPDLAVDEGDYIRIGEQFYSRISKIQAQDGAIVLELNDEYNPMDDSEDREQKICALFVIRENKILDIPEATTIAFNVARLHEASGSTLAAIELHKAIVKRNPAYVNSYLRLACIAVDCGSLKECGEWLKLSAAAAPGNSEVLTLIGNLHLSLCDWKPAQEVFDGLMASKNPSVEAYASLSMGSIFFENLHVNELRYGKNLQYASDFYKGILSKDPLNTYAANGLGTVMAEKGEIFKAKDAFLRVREVSGDTIADALLNLGHIFLAQKKHPEALQVYKNYMKLAEDSTTPITSKSRADDVVDVLQYIAFAYFDWARHTELSNDANAAPADSRYKEAMKYLEMAIEKHTKKEVIVRYNLCMTTLQAANCILQKQTRNIPRTVEEVEDALKGLNESLVIVESILKDKEEGNKKINIKTSVLEDFIKHCKANITSAQRHLDSDREKAEEEKAEREIRRLAAEASAKEEALKRAIQKEEESRRQEARDRKAEAKLRQLEHLKVGWDKQQQAQEAEKIKKARKGNPGMEGFLVDDEEQADDGGDGEHGHGLFRDSDDDDSGTDKPKDKPKKKEKEKQKKPKLKKADAGGKNTPSKNDLFGDDSDDDSDKVADTSKIDQSSRPKSLFDDTDEESDRDDQDEALKDSETKKKAEDLFGESSDEGEVKERGIDKDNESKSTKATSNDLFGDSDDDDNGEESDEELIKPDAKRAGESKEKDDQPKKKRRLLDDDA